jgi:hypothetical protein
MFKKTLIISLLITILASFTPPKNYWKILEKTSIFSRYDSTTIGSKKEIIFHSKVKQLVGQEIILEGYLHTLCSDDNKVLVISKDSIDYTGCSQNYLAVDIIRLKQYSVRHFSNEWTKISGVLDTNTIIPSEYIYTLNDCFIVSK